MFFMFYFYFTLNVFLKKKSYTTQQKPLRAFSDDSSKAKASDHLIPVIIPKTSDFETSHKRTVIKRPMPDSSMREFGRWAATESWEEIIKGENINKMFNKL